MTDLGPDQISTGWDAVQETYEKVFESYTTLIAQDMLELADTESAHRVIDVGAGTGALTFAAATLCGNVLAVDFSRTMVERIAEKARNAGVENVTTSVMDGQALDVKSKSCDRAFGNFSVIFFPEPEKGLSEMCRVLRSNGRAAVSTWSDPGRIEVVGALVGALTSAFPQLPRPSPVWLCFQDADVLKDAMSRAGFTGVEIATRTRAWVVPSADWLCEHIGGFSPAITALFSHIGDDGVDKVLTALRKDLVERHGEGEVSFSNCR